MRAILKRHLDSKTLFIGANRPASLHQLAAPVLSQGNQMSCSQGMKLLLVRSPPQGIEQTSTRSRTNDPGRRPSGRLSGSGARYMNISHKLITLGLAFSLLGGTSAFAKPTPCFENGCLSYKKKTVESHVPTAKTSGAAGFVRRT